MSWRGVTGGLKDSLLLELISGDPQQRVRQRLPAAGEQQGQRAAPLLGSCLSGGRGEMSEVG